jgi:hypothetical protein
MAKRENEGSDEEDLIKAEFDSIVEGLSLDESSPTTYLDELDRFEEAERFTPPNPKWLKLDQTQRISVSTFIASGIYLLVYTFTDFEIFGVWPAVLGVLASIATKASKIAFDTLSARSAVSTKYIIPIIFCLVVSFPPAMIN